MKRLKNLTDKKSFQNITVVFFLGIILILNISSLKHKSLTLDERGHHGYGTNILRLDSIRLIDTQMPFSALNALPMKVAQVLYPSKLPKKLRRLPAQIKTGRYVTILFSLLLAFIIFRWTRKLYGFIPGVFSLFIYTFSPNIIAHSRLVTVDLYAALMVTVSTFFFWQFINSGGYTRALLSAFTLGLSQLAKYTCLFLYPIFLLILLIRYAKEIWDFIRTKNFKKLEVYLRAFFVYSLVFLVVSIIIINGGFLFHKSFTPVGQYEFRSDLCQSLQSKWTILKNFPVPLPYPYIEGIDWGIYNERTGRGSGNAYLLGKLRERRSENYRGFRGYYFWAFLFKVPLAIQLFILISIIAYILNRKKYRFLKNELFLLVPVLVYSVYLNFFFRRQLGIRHFLVVFPLLFIFCGSLLKNWQAFRPIRKGSVVLLLVYLLLSVLSYFPHYISYFNELVWDRTKAYKILADSNIDWGQNREYLREYKKRHPEIFVRPRQPRAGRIVVSVNRLVGVFNPAQFRWLRENFEPVDHVAYSYLVYDIPPEALKKIQ